MVLVGNLAKKKKKCNLAKGAAAKKQANDESGGMFFAKVDYFKSRRIVFFLQREAPG